MPPDPLDLALELFLSAKTAERCSEWTLRIYRRALVRFCAWLRKQDVRTPAEVSAVHVRAYMIDLAEDGLKASSVHDYMRPVKTWLRFLYADGVLIDNPMLRVKMPRQDCAVLPAFTVDDVKRLLAACKRSRDAARDRALVLVLLDTGVRAAECCALTVGDVDIRSGSAVVRRGKGGKGRTVYLGAQARRALTRYLLARAAPAADAPLFVSLNFGEALTVFGLIQVCKRLGVRAGVAHCHPHTFRRTFAIWSLRAGMDLVRLAALMGHADLQVLRRYLALTEHDLSEAHRQHGAVDSAM